MTNPVEIFDPRALRLAKSRATRNFAKFDFLHRWAAHNLAERLGIVRREFHDIVHIGGRGADALREKFPHVTVISDAPGFRADIMAQTDFLPFRAGAFDLALSALELHSVNDLPGALLQIRQALRPDGLFLAAMFGGETLFELRQCLTDAEIALRGGISPRVFPFADKQQMGALMQRAGFALPVIDSEIVTVTYDNAFALMRDIRGMGEGNIIAARNRTNPGKALFFEAARLYAERFAEEDGRIPARFEIIFLLGWAPHESQQKPLKPGSAEFSLADRLKS